MATCYSCGGEIEFRFKDGECRPIHLSGAWCGADGVERQSQARPVSRIDNRLDDICFPTKCPKCHDSVYFIQHNDGRFWVDELGWPWPKHKCFECNGEPQWVESARTIGNAFSGAGLQFGLIVRAKWILGDSRGPTRVVLAFEGNGARQCFATEGTNTADYFTGQFAIVDVRSRQLFVTNSMSIPRTILGIDVSPKELDLPADWTTLQ